MALFSLTKIERLELPRSTHQQLHRKYTLYY
jgi:hypothetical protein